MVPVLARLGLALAPAAMLGAYAAFPMLAFLPWIALVPWAVLYTDDRRERPSWAYYVVGAYAAWLLQYSQAERFGWYAPFLLGLAFLPWCLPFAPLLSWLHRRVGLPRSITVALAWTSAEWLRATFTVAHFDLYGLGYSQARFPIMVQLADLIGVYGVTFVIAGANGWIADGILTVRDVGWRRSVRTPRIAWGFAALAATTVVAGGYGIVRLQTIHTAPGPRLALVQPNLAHSPRNLIDVHLAQLLLTERGVPAGEADLIVWPENAILDEIRRDGAYLDDLGWLAREKGAWILVGALENRRDRPGRTTNGAWLIDTDGSIRGSYRKRILFPWSEYIPGDAFFGRWLPSAQRLYRWIVRLGWGFQPTGTPGDRAEILEFPWRGGEARVAPLICVENAYPPVPAAAGHDGADFFLNITSEGLVGGPVQEQLLRIAIFRAIENRMAYVRVGNTGISGVIDPLGRVTAVLRGPRGATIDTAGILLTTVPVAHLPNSPYARSHDLFAKLVLGATSLLLLLGVARRFRRAGAVAAASLLLAGCMAPPPLDGVADEVGGNLARGRVLLSEGKTGAAIRNLAAACATEDGCRESMPVLYDAYARGKSDDVAAATFERIAERYPALRPEALVAHGYFLERILDLESARAAYLASIDARPTALAYERLGRLDLREERPDDAVRTLRAGTAIAPDDLRLRYLLGRALWLAGDLGEGERVLSALVADHLEEASAWTVLAWIGLMRGDQDAAESCLRKALALRPVPSEARYLASKLALRRHDWDAVEGHITALRASR